MNIHKTVFRVTGMTCGLCEKRIVQALKRIRGVRSASASFAKKRVEVTFDPALVPESDLRAAIEKEGYRVLADDKRRQPLRQVAPIFLIVLAVYFLIKYTLGFDFVNLIPRIDSSLSLLALFAVGLLTSVHCVAMCGGINISQSVGTAESTAGRISNPLLYNLGRVISYTVIGGIVGGVGSVLFVSQAVKGIIMLIAAVFMIFMSLSILGWLPWWLVPRLPAFLHINAGKAKSGRGPFVVGLLNGLLPCGPLQAMQLYALSTGSVLLGSLSMLLFSLGTVPLMLGAGLVFSALKGRFTRVVSRISAVLVMLIAVSMLFNAGGLFGWSVSAAAQDDKTSFVENLAASGYAVAQIKNGVQKVEAGMTSSRYPSIVVQKGMPVQFNLTAGDSVLTGCNETIVIRNFNLSQQLQTGDNIIEFTPDQTGSITYTCWMGMVSGTIVVVDNLSGGADEAEVPSAESTPAVGGIIENVGGGCCG